MPAKKPRLKKELRLFDVYAIATGATLSAGFFLLPGIAAVQAGPGLVLAYLLAAIPMIPAMFSVIELATAMPRAGGVYYFLDRSLGPFFGTIGGIGTWLALILKVAFALVGMGAYISLFFPNLHIVPVALSLAVLLGLVNILGTKKSGGLQIALVLGLLFLLAVFMVTGAFSFHPEHFNGFLDAGLDAIFSTAGLVYISYVGVTKVASLSEEVRNPERNLPLAVIFALGTAILIYGVGTAIIVGLVPPSELKNNLTPVATAAEYALGAPGLILLSIAALLAFVSVANAGMMSASRYPLAMSRDHLLPSLFRRLSRFETPLPAIIVTVGTIIAIILLFDPVGIAKLASSFQLLMFALVCIAVIVMRESQITSYDPGFRSPLYPWMQLAGVILPFFLIYEMGIVPMAFSIGLIIAAAAWYFFYGRRRVNRVGAIFHVFERLGRNRHHDLDTELRGILKEKGLREEDPFDEIVSRSLVFDLQQPSLFEQVVDEVATALAPKVRLSAEEIRNQIMEGTRVGATPVTRGVALPHFRTDSIEKPVMALVRARQGVRMKTYDPLTYKEEDEVTIYALFFLVSPESNPTQHLRILARIAERVDEDSFSIEWNKARDEYTLRECLLHDDHFLTINIENKDLTRALIGIALRDMEIPKGCLVAMLCRDNQCFVPDGDTILLKKDRLTVIGDEKGLITLKRHYEGSSLRSPESTLD